MAYDPCTCCWKPGFPDESVDQMPTDAEIIEGVPELGDLDPAIMPGDLSPAPAPPDGLIPMLPPLPGPQDGEQPDAPSLDENSGAAIRFEPVTRPASFFEPSHTRGAPVMRRIPRV